MKGNLIWMHAKCPICKRDYIYPAGDDKPSTCGNFECIRKYLIRKEKGVMPIAERVVGKEKVGITGNTVKNKGG